MTREKIFKLLNFKKDQEDRLQREFYQEIDRRLQTILYFVIGFLASEWGVKTVITHLLRTQDEQDNIYQDNPDPVLRTEYLRSPWTSVHQIGRGADVRVRWKRKIRGDRDLTQEEQDEIVASLDNQLRARFAYDFGRKPTSLRHNVGAGDHIHVQVDANTTTPIKR